MVPIGNSYGRMKENHVGGTMERIVKVSGPKSGNFRKVLAHTPYVRSAKSMCSPSVVKYKNKNMNRR